MTRQRLISREEIRQHCCLLLSFVLLAAVVNVPLAVSWFLPPAGSRVPFEINRIGTDLPARWPSRTPHQKAWTTPTQWMEHRGFGVRIYEVYSSDENQERQTKFQMHVERYGWPLPVIEKKMMWWDWNDPALKGPESAPAPLLLVSGLVLNPLAVGVAVWVLLCGPFIARALVRRTWRRRQDHCVWCDYPIGVSPVCSECGAMVPAASPEAG